MVRGLKAGSEAQDERSMAMTAEITNRFTMLVLTVIDTVAGVSFQDSWRLGGKWEGKSQDTKRRGFHRDVFVDSVLTQRRKEGSKGAKGNGPSCGSRPKA